MATKNPQQSGSSIKQEREARRLEKVEAFKAQQRRERTKKLVITISSIVAAIVAVVIVVVALVSSGQPKPTPTTTAVIGKVQSFTGLDDAAHVAGTVDYFTLYGMNPPAGGDHNQVWLNCGVYDQPVPNENAVHDLEHGAVWITYDADTLSKDDVATLQEIGTDPTYQGYILVSPYEGLPAPVVASAWGFQVALDKVDDPRLTDFIQKYLLAETAREPGAPCTGGLDAPGRVS
jgi:hypothetical protein